MQNQIAETKKEIAETKKEIAETKNKIGQTETDREDANKKLKLINNLDLVNIKYKTLN